MRSVRELDSRLTALIQDLPPSTRQIMLSVSFLGEPSLVLSVGFVGFLSAAIRRQTDVERAFVYAGAAFALSTLLKLSLRRARPHNLDIRTLGVRSYSFPSGHAFGTVIFYGLFSYLDIRYLSPPWNLLVGTLVGFLIFLTGVSRVYLKAHYPSDVLGGWLLGLVCLFIVTQLAF